MEIMRIALLGIVGAILAVTLQQQKKEMALVFTLAVGVLLLWQSKGWMETILIGFRQLAEGSGLSRSQLKLLFKLLAASYLTEFGSEICQDAGQQSLASKIQLGGKLMMAALAMPVFLSLMEMITGLLV